MILITLNCLRLIIRYTFQSYFLQRSIYLCRTYKFLTNYLSHCAVWILCAISLERAAVTQKFLWNQNIFNHKHSYVTLLIIYTVLFLLNLHYLIFFGSEEETISEWVNNQTGRVLLKMCSSNLNITTNATYEKFLIFYFSWIDFIINSLIPFIIILISNISVMYSVCQSRILMRELGIRQTRSPRDTQLAYILFVSTFLFLLLTFPIRVFSVIEPYLTSERKYLILFDGISRFLLYIDHGCGFYLYTFTGELFRREFKKIFDDFFYLIFRRRVFHISSIESRRQSEGMFSNGSGPANLLSFQPQQLASLYPRDSISSIGGGRSSVYSLPTQKTYHQRPMNPFSSPVSHGKNCTFRARSDLAHTHNPSLVKRHSSSCLESRHRPQKRRPFSAIGRLGSEDLDRKSDII